MAAEPGFESGLEDPKSPVLPLHNSALSKLVPKVGRVELTQEFWQKPFIFQSVLLTRFRG